MSRINTNIPALSLLVFASSLHFLVDLPIGGTKIRICASDVFLPLFLIFSMYIGYKQFNKIIVELDKKLLFSILSVTLLFLYSLYVGKLYTGSIQSWGLINKTIGWLVLLAYMFTGYTLVLYTKNSIDIFLSAFFVTGWCIAIIFLFKYSLFHHGILEDRALIRIQGYYANPNAYGFVSSVLFILQLPYINQNKLFPYWLHIICLAIMTMAIFLSGSRSAMLGMLFALPVMFYLRQISLKTVALTFLAVLFLVGINQAAPHVANYLQDISNPIEQIDNDAGNNLHQQNKRALYAFREDYSNDGGLKHRIELTKRAIALWQDKPLLGIGLGSYYWDQKQQNYKAPSVIHNTALWILTEMGVVGVVLFLALFFFILKIMWFSHKNGTAEPILPGAMGMIFVFIGVSVGTEALYQRYLWLLLGMAIATSASVKKSSYSSP